MKLLYTTIFLVIFSGMSYCQNDEPILLDHLTNEKTSLQAQIKVLQDSLKNIEANIKNISDNLILDKYFPIDQKQPIFTTIKGIANIRRNAGDGVVIDQYSNSELVQILDYSNGYWLTQSNTIKGYIKNMDIVVSKEMEDFKLACDVRNKQLEKEEYQRMQFNLALAQKEIDEKIAVEKLTKEKENKKKEQERIKKEEERKTAIKKRKDNLIAEYGITYGTKIFEGRFWLGMTDEMAIESLGKPEKINKSVGRWGVHEQWVYDSTYLYFENGILNSYQLF